MGEPANQPPAGATGEESLSLGLDLPDAFEVSVIMERRPSSSPWLEHAWSAIGVTVGGGGRTLQPERVYFHPGEGGPIERFRFSGYTVRLYQDECERYYHNLISTRPRCFVIVTAADTATPRPFLVTLDFDEAHAYEEVNSQVYPVDLPPELYRWCEAFVLENYVQERRFKRQLKDWSDDAPADDHEADV